VTAALISVAFNADVVRSMLHEVLGIGLNYGDVGFMDR